MSEYTIPGILRKALWGVAKLVLSTVPLTIMGHIDQQAAKTKLREILDKAVATKSPLCRKGEVSRMCEVERFVAPRKYNKYAGGVDNLIMYTIYTLDGQYIHIQFYNYTPSIWYWLYDKDHNLLPPHGPQKLDPVEALEKIKEQSGIGVETSDGP